MWGYIIGVLIVSIIGALFMAALMRSASDRDRFKMDGTIEYEVCSPILLLAVSFLPSFILTSAVTFLLYILFN